MYKCETCNYIAKRKYHLHKHLLTKKHKNNITRKKANTNANTYINEPNDSQPIANNEPVRANKEPIKRQNNNKNHYCDYCKKKFSSKANKRRHERHRCLVKKQQNINE